MHRGAPKNIRSDNGPEFSAKAVRQCLQRVGVQTSFIEPGNPWENGYVENFNGRLHDNVLEQKLFAVLWEVWVLVERWRQRSNHVRLRRTLRLRPPPPEAYA